MSKNKSTQHIQPPDYVRCSKKTGCMSILFSSVLLVLKTFRWFCRSYFRRGRGSRQGSPTSYPGWSRSHSKSRMDPLDCDVLCHPFNHYNSRYRASFAHGSSLSRRPRKERNVGDLVSYHRGTGGPQAINMSWFINDFAPKSTSLVLLRVLMHRASSLHFLGTDHSFICCKKPFILILSKR